MTRAVQDSGNSDCVSEMLCGKKWACRVKAQRRLISKVKGVIKLFHVSAFDMRYLLEYINLKASTTKEFSGSVCRLRTLGKLVHATMYILCSLIHS